MEELKFIFSDFWIWLGFMFLIGGIFTGIYNIIQRILRHYSLKKLGYPPSHCDADGDFQKKDNNKD